MLAERLQGVLLILAGCSALVVVMLAQASGWLQVRLPLPAGIQPESIPVLTPLACILPLTALGGLGLVMVGLRKLLSPDDWRPPRHGE